MAGGIWGQTRSFGDRTFDPLNLPNCREDGRGWLRDPDMGTDTELRHGIRTTRLLIRRTWPSPARTVQSRRGGQIWGQARCLGTGGANRGTDTMSDIPVRNVQRPAFNS